MQNDIDQILGDEEQITPSLSFLQSVMEAVEREAALPQPLKFPWSRALPGLLAMITALVVAIWNGIDSLNDPATLAIFDEQLRQYASLAAGIGLQWIAIAVVITIVSLMLSASMTRVSYSVQP